MIDTNEIIESLKQHRDRVERLEKQVDYWKSVVRSVLDNNGKMTHMQKKAIEEYFHGSN